MLLIRGFAPVGVLALKNLMRPGSKLRIAAVMAGVSGLGVMCGAVLGPLAIWLEDMRLPGTTNPDDLPGLWFVAALGGALFGAVLAPAVAWIFVRRVPLARAIAETSCGVLIGFGVGVLIHPFLTVWFGLVGFVLAAA